MGNLTSALTASVAFTVNEVDLYQAKVSILSSSYTFQFSALQLNYYTCLCQVDAVVYTARSEQVALTLLQAF